MLLGKRPNRLILLIFDALNLILALLFLILPQEQHLVLKPGLNLIRNALILLPRICILLVVGFGQRIQEILVTHLLLLLGHLQRPDVLFQLALGDPMLVLNVFEGDLRVFFQLSQLVLVLENQVLETLLVDLDFDLVLLLQILELSLLVPQLGLLVFKLLLAHQPKVVDSQTLIVVEPNQVLLLLDELLKVACLYAQGLLEFVVVDVVHGISTGFCLLLGGFLLACGRFLRWHFINYLKFV